MANVIEEHTWAYRLTDWMGDVYEVIGPRCHGNLIVVESCRKQGESSWRGATAFRRDLSTLCEPMQTRLMK